MSASQTVPMFSPDGQLGDIPYEQMNSARQAGFKPAVVMKSSDGKEGYIPADRIQDAAKSGLQIVPLKNQDTQHPGFWHELTSDLVNMAKAAPQAALDLAVPGLAAGKSAKETIQSVATTGKTSTQLQYEQQKAEGRPMIERLATPAAQMIGMNVRGTEQSADQGDIAGVAGHAAAPLAMAAVTEGASRAIPKVVKTLTPNPEALYQSALKPSTTLSPAERSSIIKTGLKNEIPVSPDGAEKIVDLIDELNTKIKDTIDTGTRQGVTINKFDVADRLKTTGAKFKNQVNPGEDIQAITESGKEFLKTQPRNIPASQAQSLKQGTYSQLKGKAYGELKGASIEAQKALARGIKEELANAFPELNQLNQAESRLFDLQPEIERALGRQGNHQLMGVGTPAVAGAAKAVTGSNLVSTAAATIKAIVDNPIVKSRIAIALNRKGVPMATANARVAAYSAALSAASQQSADQNNQP